MASEDHKERVDRELIELLQELRVAIPGVQVLFAFLLTVPFGQRFPELPEGTQRIYFGTVLITAATTFLLMAPTAHHRMRFRKGAKEELVKAASIMAVAGMGTLAIAMGMAVYVVADMLYSGGAAALVAAVMTGGAALLWFVSPLLYRSDLPEDRSPEGSSGRHDRQLEGSSDDGTRPAPVRR